MRKISIYQKPMEDRFSIEENGEVLEDMLGYPLKFNNYSDAMDYIKEEGKTMLEAITYDEGVLENLKKVHSEKLHKAVEQAKKLRKEDVEALAILEMNDLKLQQLLIEIEMSEWTFEGKTDKEVIENFPRNFKYSNLCIDATDDDWEKFIMPAYQEVKESVGNE